MGLSIGILGTRGIPNHYGGFEQVASSLSKRLVAKGHKVSVYNTHDHPYTEDTWNGVQIIRCYNPPLGTAGQFVYDLNCLLDSASRRFDVLLLLGYTSSSVWGKWYPKGPVIINNMDGLEWKRTKYSKPVRLFLRYAERLAVRFSDYYIADSPAIRDYLQWQYGIRSRFIPYGADVLPGPRRKHLQEWGLSPGQYCILMARMEPENNIEMVLEGFCLSLTPQKILVIGDMSNAYGKHIIQRFGTEPRIIFAGSLFEPEALHSLKAFCHLYFHGHSVGGTNPSLLEAMASRALIAAHDNPFNRAVLGEDAFYFSGKEGIARVMDQSTERTASVAYASTGRVSAGAAPTPTDMVAANFEKIATRYNWEKVTDAYENFMYECYAEKRQPISYPTVPDLSPVRSFL